MQCLFRSSGNAEERRHGQPLTLKRHSEDTQDAPEWDAMETTAVIGRDGVMYDMDDFCDYYDTALYLGRSPSALRARGITHEVGPQLSVHCCRPAYQVPTLETSRIGVRMFPITRDNMLMIMTGKPWL